MHRPFQRIRAGAISLLTLFVVSVIGYRLLGGYDWLEAVWLVVVTVSTVGYSEHTDSSASLQIFTILVIVLGVSASVYTCGGFIQLLFEGEVEKALGRRKLSRELKQLENHVVICGYGRLGLDLATQLQHRGVPFVVIDNDAEKIALARERGYLAVPGDATSEEVLEEVRIRDARALATALPSDAENVFITLTARNIRPDIQIIAKSDRESSCRKLRQAGADKVVMPHRIGAQQMERMISRPNTADLVELFAEATNIEMELDEIRVSDKSRLVGATLESSNIRNEFNLLVIGLKGHDGLLNFNPEPKAVINASDTLLVIGDINNINRLRAAT